jgi:DNA segregation ATPase FtsK/SpoIIIE-like protein
VKWLLTTGAGRFTLTAVPLAVVAAVLWRDRLVAWLGLGLIPLGVWSGVALYMSVAMPRRLIASWRLAAGAFVCALAFTGLLGMFNHPVETVLGQITSGGNVGRLIARAPFEWPVVEPGVPHLLLASLRVAAVGLLAASIFMPRRAASFAAASGRLAVRSTAATASWLAMVRARLAERSEQRRRVREAERLAAIAAFETEASMLEFPPTEVVRSRDAGSPVTGIRPAPPTNDGPSTAMEPEPASGSGGARDTAPVGPALRASTGAPLSAPGALNGSGALHSAAGAASAAAAGAAGVGTKPAVRPSLPHYNWKLPSLDLLKSGRAASIPQSEIEATSDLIVDTLAEHGVEVKISQVTAGPAVTMYGIAPGWERSRHRAAGRTDRWEEDEQSRKRVRVDTILAREKDLALALASPNIRFEAPIPGESLVGIEVPNAHPSIVTLRSVMQTDAFKEFERKSALPIALGIASSSGDVLADLTKMPHLLVAGATGSGKSVCMNTIISGFLLTRTPAQLQMILIDPKRVELTPYAGVPHLACPPVVEADRAVRVLKAVVKEMMARYALFEAAGAKNIAAYNEKSGSRLPYLVVAIDELADLMLTSANEVERLIVRLAQLGRATGVHLIVATQRPSVDVVTGLIKANFPSRIAFAMSSQVDSRTILDSNGAERLLGRGDMLFLPIDRPRPMRIQGAFLTDGEVESVVRTWRTSGGPRIPELVVEEAPQATDEDGDHGGDDDSLLNRAQELAQSQTRLSTSLLQRRLRIGYPRAARLMDELEEAGIVGAGEPGKPRQVLVHQ